MAGVADGEGQSGVAHQFAVGRVVVAREEGLVLSGQVAHRKTGTGNVFLERSEEKKVPVPRFLVCLGIQRTRFPITLEVLFRYASLLG